MKCSVQAVLQTLVKVGVMVMVMVRVRVKRVLASKAS